MSSSLPGGARVLVSEVWYVRSRERISCGALVLVLLPLLVDVERGRQRDRFYRVAGQDSVIGDGD